MNKESQNRWKNEVLEHILSALAAHESLNQNIIFKGARILNLRLSNTSRQSLDIDSSVDNNCELLKNSDKNIKAYFLREISIALRRFFNKQSPVRYVLTAIKVEMSPRHGGHHFGWLGYKISINIQDNNMPDVRGLPKMEIDIGASEKLSEKAVSDLKLPGGYVVRAYTLERIAGEKLRAFLSSLPCYVRKTGKRLDVVRVKDLYDLARIISRHPITDSSFWDIVADEFYSACESRFIDCTGLDSFSENLETTKSIYQNDPTLPTDIKFDKAWKNIAQIVKYFEGLKIIPFTFPVPES